VSETRRTVMPEKDPQSDASQATNEPAAADQPNPNVKPPRPVWISKSYSGGKSTRDGTQDGGKKKKD